MSQEERKQVSLNQFIGHAITIAVLIATLAASQGSMMAQTGALQSQIVEVKTTIKSDVTDIRQSSLRALEENTKVMQSLDRRVSRIEGKLEK